MDREDVGDMRVEVAPQGLEPVFVGIAPTDQVSRYLSGVDAEVEAGAKVPFLSEIGWTGLGTGAVLMIAAAALLVAGIRTPRNRTGAGTGLAPATA